MKEMLNDKTNGVLPLPDDMTGKVCVLRPEALGKRWQKPEFQLVKCVGGFGCHKDKLGTKVFGEFLADGEETTYRRFDFIGEATQELVDKTLAETEGEDEFDPTDMCYLAIGSGGMYQKAPTMDEAKKKLRARRSKCLQVFHCHSETQVTDWGGLAYNRNAPEPKEVWRRKGV